MRKIPFVTAALIALLWTGTATPTAASPGEALAPAVGSPQTGVQASADGRGHRHSHGPDGLDLDRRGAPRAVVAAQSVDRTLTGPWSTADPLPVRTTDQPDLHPRLPSIHLVYVYGSDVKSPRTSFLNMFEADARAAQAFLLQEYGRSVRFDERTVAQGAATSTARIDITVVKSRYRTRQLGSSDQFNLVSSELDRVFPDSESPRKKYIAWLDAPSRYCGQGELYGDWHRDKHNWNDLRTTGIVYRPYEASGADGGFCRGRTLLHELGHNLGALYSKAPSALAFDGAHCKDDDNDVMCYTPGARDTSAADPRGNFDYGNDDYWDAGAVIGSDNGSSKDLRAHLDHLNWWTVNLSRFVCRPGMDGPASADCGNTATEFPTVDEFRYHSGAETDPPPQSQPTG